MFADLVVLSRQRKEDHASVGARNAEFNPALISECLVRHDLESEFLRVKPKGFFLIPDGNAYEFDAANHHLPPQSDSAMWNCRVKVGGQ
jgi:hypothetical protein